MRCNVQCCAVLVAMLVLTAVEAKAQMLQAHWALDGNFLDSSVNTNNGTFERGGAPVPGEVSFVAGFNGAPGGAVSLDGNHYVRIPSNATLNPGTGGFTTTAWVNVATGNVGDQMRIYDSRGRGTGVGFQFKVQPFDGTSVSFHDTRIEDTTTIDGPFFNETSLDTVRFPSAQWHHVAMVYAADSTLRVFVDGVNVNDTTSPGIDTLNTGTQGSLDNTRDRAIGAALALNGSPYLPDGDPNTGDPNADDQHFVGAIDDVAFFSRTLMDQEVMAMFSLGDVLGYDVGDANALFILHANQAGSEIIDNLSWQYSDNINTGLGIVTPQNGQFFLQLDASGTGVFSQAVPEPASIAIWLFLGGVAAFGFRQWKRSRRDSMRQ